MTSPEPVKALPGWSEAATLIEGADNQDELRNLIAKAKQRLKQLESGSGAVNQMQEVKQEPNGGSANIGNKRRRTSTEEEVRESSSDEKCTKSSSDEKQADIAIKVGNFSMIIFSALPRYTIKGLGDLAFEQYLDEKQDTGAVQLEGTRHTAYYIPFDGVESGMEILYYVSYHERTYPQYITERDMERKEPNETNGIWHADDSDAYVHYCNNFRQLATNVS